MSPYPTMFVDGPFGEGHQGNFSTGCRVSAKRKFRYISRRDAAPRLVILGQLYMLISDHCTETLKARDLNAPGPMKTKSRIILHHLAFASSRIILRCVDGIH